VSGKNKRKRKGGGGGRPVTSGGPADAVPRLREIVAAIEAAEDPAACGPQWGETHKLMLKAKVDPGFLARLIATRDLDALRGAVDALGEGRDPAAAPSEEPEAAPTPAADVDPEALKLAMRSFRKRLKLTRLDHESRLSVSPMTSGKKSDIRAIMAPHEYPVEVWDALVAEGKLRPRGPGFYELAEEPE
jgi:hypothetical protein